MISHILRMTDLLKIIKNIIPEAYFDIPLLSMIRFNINFIIRGHPRQI